MKKRKWNKRANNGHTRTGAWAATPLCPSDDDVVCPVQGFFFSFFYVAKFSQLAKQKKFKVAKNMWFFSFPSRQASEIF
jgi:hypothetical protein